jgi:hypothetical protein
MNDPKPENYDSGKLRKWRAVWSSKRRDEGAPGCRRNVTRESRFCVRCTRLRRYRDRRHMPRAWHQRGNVLRLEPSCLRRMHNIEPLQEHKERTIRSRRWSSGCSRSLELIIERSLDLIIGAGARPPLAPRGWARGFFLSSRAANS